MCIRWGRLIRVIVLIDYCVSLLFGCVVKCENLSDGYYMWYVIESSMIVNVVEDDVVV